MKGEAMHLTKLQHIYFTMYYSLDEYYKRLQEKIKKDTFETNGKDPKNLYLPLSGAVAAKPGSEGGSKLSKRLLTLFLSSISSLRRYFTWLDSKGRG